MSPVHPNVAHSWRPLDRSPPAAWSRQGHKAGTRPRSCRCRAWWRGWGWRHGDGACSWVPATEPQESSTDPNSCVRTCGLPPHLQRRFDIFVVVLNRPFLQKPLLFLRALICRCLESYFMKKKTIKRNALWLWGQSIFSTQGFKDD